MCSGPEGLRKTSGLGYLFHRPSITRRRAPKPSLLHSAVRQGPPGHTRTITRAGQRGVQFESSHATGACSPSARSGYSGPLDVLGAHNLSGFVAHNLSGFGWPIGRLDEPDGGAARSADAEVCGGVRSVAGQAGDADAGGRGAGGERPDVPALGGAVRGTGSGGTSGHALDRGTRTARLRTRRSPCWRRCTRGSTRAGTCGISGSGTGRRTAGRGPTPG